MTNFFRFLRSPKKEPPMNPQPIQQEQPAEKRGHLPHLRRIRNRKPSFEIQDRDVEMLHAISIDRATTATMLKLLFPPDKAKTPPHVFTDKPKRSGTNIDRRLSGLFHYGYVERIRTELGGELFYLLTSKGVQLLMEKQLPLPLELTVVEKAKTPKRMYLEHSAMVAHFRTAMICANREHPSLQLDHYEREATDLKADWKREDKRIYVNPDAFFILKNTAEPEGRNRQAYFLEADRSTMHLARLMEKFARYSLMYADRVQLQAFGVPNFRVLTVCKSKERAGNLLSFLANTKTVELELYDTKTKTRSREKYEFPEDHKSFFFFTSEEAYTEKPQNIFAEIWKRPDDPKPFRSILRADPLPVR